MIVVGRHKLFQGRLFVDDCIVHVVHVIIHIFKDIGGDASD